MRRGVNFCFKIGFILKVYRVFWKYKVTQTLTNKIILKIYGHTFSRTLFILENLCTFQNMLACVMCIYIYIFGYQTPLTSYDNYQFKEMVFNMPQSYFLFQIIINFLNNMWYPKISLNPMMCMALKRLYRVHDNLRYDEGARNILATVMFNTSSLSSFLFFLLMEFHIY